MDVAGRDHVSVIVSGEGKGQMLVDETTDPGTLIDAVRTYQPERDARAPLEDLLSLALEQLHASPSSDTRRFQAVVLLTDGASANPFLFPPLVADAQDASVSFFVLLLGAGVNENAVEALATLYEPTRGLLVHMPNVSDSDALFGVVEANATQTQLRYHSNLVATGRYPISVSLGTARDEYAFDLSLTPPQVSFALEGTTIRRVGVSADAELGELQPTVQSIPVEVTWPDAMPRTIAAATLLADGVSQEATLFGDSEALEFDWDISERDAGQYVLTAVITDSVGLAARTEPRSLTIEIVRPEPRATPAATPTATLGILERMPTIVIERRVLELGGALLVVMVLLFLWWQWRRPPITAPGAAEPVPVMPPAVDASGKAPPERGGDVKPSAILEPVSPGAQPLLLRGINITLGRDPVHADVLCDDATVAPLHARLRWHDDRYWLYDEGSASGTYLNYEKLGLAPQVLVNGDVIQLGKIRFRFRLLGAKGAGRGEPTREEG
jgi:pSer/pThr/pTyr-binding forkhead associated (FHA) protein